MVVKSRREGLVVSLRELGFYESGSATLRRSSEDSIERLAKVLGPRKEGLRIEGHTDNVPIHNKQFDSNWELSTARATELIKVFAVDYHISPDRLAAGGYAEYHPVESNDTSEGRAHNRRVDIVILTPPPPVVQVAKTGAAGQPVENAPAAARPEPAGPASK